VRNKDKPDDWMSDAGIVLLPAEADLPKGVLDNMKQSFGALFQGKK